MQKRKKKENFEKASCGACPPFGKHKRIETSSDEEESSSNLASSISSQEEDEDLDLLTVGVEANMKWRTLEDAEMDRIERLAQHLREDPLCPPPLDFGTDLLKQEGLNLPLVHCAFKGCSWISDTRPCLRASTDSRSSTVVTEKGQWTSLACRREMDNGIYGCCGEKTCLKQHIVDEHSGPLIDTCSEEQYALL